jgi:oligopeptide/dipeptide ABC transporter, ATP-binding protein, C-terminal domain
MSEGYILNVKNLSRHFYLNKDLFGIRKSVIKAVDNVSLSIKKGEIFGLIGESGCGKTTLGRTIIRLYEPTSGEIFFENRNITNVSRKAYSKRIQMIFQNPYASLDPRMTVGDIIGEPMVIHKLVRFNDRKEKIYELLDMVGLKREHFNRYPFEFSGGQRQRIGIARALAVQPEMVICDEPVSALDVSIQAQIVNTLTDLRSKLGLTYLFIAHDLTMVKYISDRVGVMYLGKLIEMACNDELYDNPLHPYTKALLAAIPIADPIENRARKRIILEGELPGSIDPPTGCRFWSRCSLAMTICSEMEPQFQEVSPGHFCACHLKGAAKALSP